MEVAEVAKLLIIGVTDFPLLS